MLPINSVNVAKASFSALTSRSVLTCPVLSLNIYSTLKYSKKSRAGTPQGEAGEGPCSQKYNCIYHNISSKWLRWKWTVSKHQKTDFSAAANKAYSLWWWYTNCLVLFLPFNVIWSLYQVTPVGENWRDMVYVHNTKNYLPHCTPNYSIFIS